VVAALVLFLGAFVASAQAARFYTPPSGKKRQYAAKRGFSDKVPFAKRKTAITQYPGRFNKPPKNSSPFRRSNFWSWSAKRR
jgi:hypothetical protein